MSLVVGIQTKQKECAVDTSFLTKLDRAVAETSFLKVFLMVILCEIECCSLCDLSDDGLFELVFFFQLNLEGIG